MKLPQPRGAFSEDLFASMTGAPVAADPTSVEDDDDLHIGCGRCMSCTIGASTTSTRTRSGTLRSLEFVPS